MDVGTIGIIVVVVALIALFIYNRSRPAPHGTYDDKKVSSSGSIGGGTRAHDDESVRSSGSIGGAGNSGGGVRAYDNKSTTSGGSIGGGPQTERRNRADTGRNSQINDDINDDIDDNTNDDDTVVRPSKNDRDHRSSGSFGGSGS